MPADGLSLRMRDTENTIVLTGGSGKVGSRIKKTLETLGFEVIKPNFLLEYKDNICCLVNCAAMFEKGNLRDTENLLECMQVNDFMPARLSQEYAKVVGKGSVINILDGNIYRFNENYQNYRISKLFLQEITRQSALLFAPDIRVNAIAFGMLEETLNESNSRALQKEILKKKVTDESISSTLEFLLRSENITGQTIYLDNGVHLL